MALVHASLRRLTGSRRADARNSLQVWHQAAELLARVPLSAESMQQRFASISRHRPSHLTTISAKKRKNASCNRYGNILPFDQNSVKVRAHAQEGSRGSYINASLVQVRTGVVAPFLAPRSVRVSELRSPVPCDMQCCQCGRTTESSDTGSRHV